MMTARLTVRSRLPGPVFVVGHLATPGWLAVLAGPLLGSRGVLENMSGWNAAGKLLDPSLLGSSGSATITRLHASFALCQPGGRCGAHIQYSGDAHRQLARVGWA